MKITIDIDESEYRTLVTALNRHGHNAFDAWEYCIEKSSSVDINHIAGLKMCSDRAFSLQGKIQEAWKGGK